MHVITLVARGYAQQHTKAEQAVFFVVVVVVLTLSLVGSTQDGTG